MLARNQGKIKILSLSGYSFGFITYQKVLEETFKHHIPEVEFKSVYLPDVKQGDLLARTVNWVLTKQVPGATPSCNRVDYAFNHFRVQLGSSFIASRYLERACKTYQPDVLHVTTQSIALLSTQLLRQFPSVLSIDLTTHLVATESSPSVHLTQRPHIALERRCFQAATHITTFSNWARRSVIEDYGVLPQRVTTVPNCMALEVFDRIANNRLPTSERLRLLFVGNDFVRKGGEDLLAVFLENFSDFCELDIVTNAPVKLPEFPNLRIHRGLRPLSSELLRLYQLADIFVMPSHEDTSPNVFIEAIAAGLPCVGTAVRGVPEIVQDGWNGFTITPGDRQALQQVLQKLIDNSSLRQSMGTAGRELAKQNFDAVTNCQKITQIFADSINQHAIKTNYISENSL